MKSATRLSSSDPLLNWIPYKLLIENDTILCQWLYVSDHSFNDPFFEETVLKCKSHHYNSARYKCVSSLESMIEWSETIPEVIPSAFIFHISRCGSTLLSQLIGLDSQYLVLSEVPFFDELLRLPYKLKNSDDRFLEKALQAGIRLTGRNRSGKEQQLFIKTDSWHIFFYKALRAVYPSALFILLYRTPGEVVASHQKLRGMHAVPFQIEPEVFGFTGKEIEGSSLDVYTANVLKTYLLMFEKVAQKDKNMLLLDYEQGAMNMMELIAAHLKINWKKEHILLMQQRSKFHSKDPLKNFKTDQEISNEEIHEYLDYSANVYDRLDKIRQLL